MKIIFETKRTYLREMTGKDYADLCEIMQDPIVMVAYSHTFSDNEVRNWLDKQIKRYEEDGIGLWALIHKETKAFIGQVGLTIQQIEGKKEVEIGYLLKRKYWHQGYATEAALSCKDYAFNVLKCNRVVSIIRETNEASINVAKRVGMKKEYEYIKHYYGIDMPHHVYVVEK